MKRTAFLFGFLLLLTTLARADDTKLVNVITPVKNGFAISLGLPASEHWKHTFSSDLFWIHASVEWQGAHNGPMKPEIRVSIAASKKSYSFDDIIDSMNNRIKNTAITVYEKGIDDTFGQETFYYLYSDVDCYPDPDGPKTPCTKPFRIAYATSMRDGVFVEAGLFAKNSDDFDQHEEMLKRVIKTVKIMAENELDQTQVSKNYTSPVVTTSSRRGHSLNNHIKITLPPGWTAEEVDVRNATKSNEQGRLVVVFHTGTTSPGASEPYEVLYVIADGMPYAALDKASYLATGERYVSRLLKDPVKLETPAATVLPDGSKAMHGFCASKAETTYSTGTGGVHVSTHEGANPDGRKLKLRIYTAGGITQACNIIYVADPETFDSASDRLDALVSSLEIVMFDPQLLQRN